MIGGESILVLEVVGIIYIRPPLSTAHTPFIAAFSAYSARVTHEKSSSFQFSALLHENNTKYADVVGCPLFPDTLILNISRSSGVSESRTHCLPTPNTVILRNDC